MKTYQILLLIGVGLSSIATAFFLVKMATLLIASRGSKKIIDKDLENSSKYMVISIVLLTICSLVFCVTSIMG